MRQEIALESDGAPVVRAFRSDEGQLAFRYLTVRAGGMSVWTPVDEDVLRSIKVTKTPEEGATLEARIRAVSLALARSMSAAEAERLERVDALEAQVEALEKALTDSERDLAAARVRVRELEQEKTEQAAAQKQAKREASRSKREAAAA